MASIKRTKKATGLVFTQAKLQRLILGWLDKHEPDLVSDFDPEDEVWKQTLAAALAAHIAVGVVNG